MKTTISDRYEVNLASKEDVIGKGGQAVVYRGYDRKLNQEVAIKIYKLLDYSENIRSLQQEYDQIARFFHPNVINYFDWAVFTYQKKILFALVMNYADLGTLDNYKANLKEKSLQKAGDVFLGILSGLKYIHSMGIVHRDLKPSNILLASEEGDGIQPIISDILFESNITPQDEKVATAHFEGIFGTIEYMAPELLGTKNVYVGPASDLWSFGVMVYEFFTGELPFGSRAGNNAPFQVAKSILTQAADVSKVPGPYNFIVEACLEKDISKRISDAQILIDVIGKYYSAPEGNQWTIPLSGVQNAAVTAENDTIIGFVNIRKQQQEVFVPPTIRLAETPTVFGTILMQDTSILSNATRLIEWTQADATITMANADLNAAGPVNLALLEEIQKLKEKIDALEKNQEESATGSGLSSRHLFQDLIAQNEIAACFSELNKMRDSFSHQLNKTYIMIRAEWSELKMQEMHGIIEEHLLKTNSNKIRYKLLDFIDLLEIVA